MNSFKIGIIGCLIAVAFMVGCDDAEYSVLRNQAYISQTNTNPNTALKVFIDKNPVDVNLNVRISDPAVQDAKFELVEDMDLLDRFNKQNFTAYKFLSSEQYRLDGKDIEVKQGHTLSSSADLNILPLTDEMKKSGEKYAVALTLKSKDGSMDVLKSGGNILYLLDPAIITSVPVFDKNTNVAFELKEDLSLNEWTLEFCVNMSKLGKKIGELNNQALFDGSSNLGEGDGQIYTRFGDAPIEGNRLQIKTQGIVMDSKMQFEENKWYHIAWVCTGSKVSLYVNGKLDNSKETTGKPTNLGKNHCKIGNTDYLKSDVKMSELRLWTRALSSREISNNPYATNPNANGLSLYFKFNEGKGKNFVDATGHGNKAWCNSEVRWIPDVQLNAQ